MPQSRLDDDAPLTASPSRAGHFRWNDDYVELLAHLLNLQKTKTLVDVGAGAGELSSLFALYMMPGAKVHGFVQSPERAAEAQAELDGRAFSVKFSFEAADASALPLPDAAADLAVCQHTLVNEPDPARVLTELARVVRPGGKVVAFEPNSLIQALVKTSVDPEDDLEARLDLVRYQAYYERGKARLGFGDDSVGDRLPSLFTAAGLTDLEIRLSDKAMSVVPPYGTRGMRARVAELRRWLGEYESHLGFMERCFLAGGGDAAAWARFCELDRAENERIASALDAGTFTHPGGALTYVVVGTKPL